MIAITMSVWIQLPVRGKFGLMFRPKKPSSHRTTRMMMMVQIMRFYLSTQTSTNVVFLTVASPRLADHLDRAN